MHKPFNEIYDDSGEVRGHYNDVYKHWQSIPKSEKSQFHKQSKSMLAGDYSLNPLPRLITTEEFQILQDGVRQRARAILAFLQDYYKGSSRWKRILPPALLRAIVDSSREGCLLGKLNPESISFPFGPDIIRDQYGRWRVVEDSAGIIGGIGDLVASHKIMFRLIPQYKKLLVSSQSPIDFFIQMTSHFKKRASLRRGIPLFYVPDHRLEDDSEPQRLSQVYKSLGIEVLIQSGGPRRLIIDDEGVFLRSLKSKERVSYVILYAGPEQTDLRCVLSELRFHRKSLLLQGALRTLQGKSIMTAFLKNQVLSNFSPGTQFINNKSFGLFVDRWIKFYLKETPVLESIPAKLLAFKSHNGNWRLDKKALERVFSNKNDFVIKKVDEDGGSGVWIGCKHTKKNFESLRSRIQSSPENYIFQKFTPLSVMENRIVDLRIHAHVDCEKIIVSNTPWGRTNWAHGDGKVNLSSNGFMSPVVVV